MDFIYKTDLPKKEALYNLYEHLEWNTFLKLNSEQLLKAMEHSYYSVYTYCGDNLIATGRIVSDGMINAYLCGLGVHPQFRHKGIAKQIINMLVKHCRDNNLHIQLFCEDYLASFYKKIGFEEFAIGMIAKES